MTNSLPTTRSSVFTIPPGRPFLSVLATAILNGDLPQPGGTAPRPLDLPAITLILPTRRSVKAMQQAFLTASNGRALLLPVIRPIGQGDEEQDLLHQLSGPERFGGAGTEILPSVPEIERRLVLTELVLAWSKAIQRQAVGAGEAAPGARASTPAQALQLAAELAALMDMVETEQRDLSGLSALVPAELSAHWQQTLDFLRIITDFWPNYLQEKSLCAPAARRNALIEAEARRLGHAPPAGPVIIAGVTGSVPATAALMKVVAGLANGAVVLPGLDPHLDDASWNAIDSDADRAQGTGGALVQLALGAGHGHAEHPQFGLKRVLRALGVDRHQVRVVPGGEPSRANASRSRFMAEAMRPAATTGHWHTYVAAGNARDDAKQALDHVTLIEADSAQEEADAIALIMRAAAEEKGQTAALITPDRNLGRRVAVLLERWGLRIDDSSGRPLSKTPPGVFLDLVIDAAQSQFEPARLLALLKHPLTRLGLPVPQTRRAARALELIVFRQVYIGQGLTGIARALERAADEANEGRRRRTVRRLREADWHAAQDFVARLTAAYAPLTALYEHHENPSETRVLAELAAAHCAVAEALASDDTGEPVDLWTREDGEAAALFFARLQDAGTPTFALRAVDYADFYRSLLQGQAVRPSVALHPRLFIWGPFESRLLQPDVAVLGGLNDGVWPEAADPGPWLNRAMRQALGLPAPEERLGFSAHDFTQAFGAPQVVMTRATKIDGAPTVPSRWLLRIDALLGGMGLKDAMREPADTPWLAWARAMREIPKPVPVKPPSPKPPFAARPRTLSVSDVETWIANPYAIYARHILGLEPMPPIAGDPGADLRGSLIHQALHRFAKEFPNALPNDTTGVLVGFLDETLASHAAHPRVAAFWRPRFVRFAQWFSDTEPQRRQGVTRIVSEVPGKLSIPSPAGRFELTARADRIDLLIEGTHSSVVITDYKTGAPPNDKKVQAHDAPQLPLEAAIAAAAGFSGVGAAQVKALRYIRAQGGEPPGEQRDIKGDAAALGAQALAGLERLIIRFDDPDTPYTPVRRARFSYDYDAYAHLARVAEWTTGDDGDG